MPFGDVFQTANRQYFKKQVRFLKFHSLLLDSTSCIPVSPFVALQPATPEAVVFLLTMLHPGDLLFCLSVQLLPESESLHLMFPLPGMLSPSLPICQILLTLQVWIYMLISSVTFSLTPETESKQLSSFLGLCDCFSKHSLKL